MRRLLMLVVSAAMLAGLAVTVPSVATPEKASQAVAASLTGPVWLNFTSEWCLRATGKNWAPVAVQAHVSPPGISSQTAKTAGTWVRVDGAFYYGRSEVDAVVWCKSGTWPNLPVPVTLPPQYRYFTGPYSYWI
jgi:hypothetical protein